MRYQRSKGLFGALIVHEAQSDIREKLGPFEDRPERKTLIIVDQDPSKKKSRKAVQSFCLPDGSSLPMHFRRFTLLIYGKDPATSPLESAGNESHTQFYVVSGRNYRFRIIDGALGTIFVISIDYHKLYIIATDGSLVKPFETDFLIVHVGETYDFILKAKKDILPGSKYPIRIQSLAVNCKNNSELAGQGFVFLAYTNQSIKMTSPTSENLIVQNDRCNNKSKPCTIMNCPFKIMPKNYSKPDTYMKCYDILSLKLLYPTPSFEIPKSADFASEFFFNFEGAKPRASLINGIRFRLPAVPILENEDAANECKYPVNC
ncbi:laccase-4-like [Paramuricea clavata]|uniref:Laccase-4-like, partial n=1 Tax=Paramuricea clavata TaxID=317549 RepID=A0A6S7IU13_PARCT|nr:laccase-4-like [Paramuricea clavata]